MSEIASSTPATACPSCHKEPPLCLCAEVRPVATNVHVLFLQHPQEPDKLLGSARLAHSVLENSTLRVGLSWPNLAKALGRPPGSVEHSRWGVLYLGAKTDRTKDPHARLRMKTKGAKDFEVYVPESSIELEGIIVLDGTWSQAKTLWWRNAWLLKLNRLAIHPRTRSMYGELRREPRRDALSTIEVVAETLEALSNEPSGDTGAPAALRAAFGELLRRYKSAPRPAR